MPAGISLADRDRELNVLLVDMVQSMDIAIERGLEDNMRLIVRPGAVTFGQPVPMESQGVTVVPPATADGKPVVIRGTMD